MAQRKVDAGGLQPLAEKNIGVLVLLIAIVVAIGGIVEIVPLFYLDNAVEDRLKNPDGSPKYPELIWDRKAGQKLSDWKPGDGLRPYTALELAGRDIYIREGCYLCHSQMVRPFRDERERYGHYSLAVESKYDHPFQWGSKRTGPDLARVGGKYSNEWHYQHLRDPRSVVPESVMPRYPWLEERTLDPERVQRSMRAMKLLGVPYTDEDIAEAPKEVAGKTEMEALVAYLQVLGTWIRFEEGKDYRE
ncbi:cytochrome-c oxidase, cbb3-type subunit II [Inmirania thermothiophila]|uniref:Cytochrome c oxidase cbb3-type subunit 2 n=1 Tax=Inmirania thermothiophila TaxID=1750597 RepID=A0A3N1Y7G8_9GAMM|nr:cytochrome-c oxidase, cbb3-type subunit II [Inmirania thermothiophila]ROR34461.1 cytochrome c oxidase cbb3-type subunit 2 [Inmirania thermothiophila]